MSDKPTGERTWRRGRPCEGGACVEVAEGGAEVLVRSSTNPANTVKLSRAEWRGFLADAKEGIFDEV